MAERRFGDRRDATLLRDTDALHFIMGIIYPNRADNEAYIAERVNLEPIKAYLAKKNVEGIPFKYTFFHVILTALVKTVTLRPKLNRFYANENYYQRNKITAGFVIKKEFSDGSEEAMALLEAKPDATIDTIHEEIRRQVQATRNEQKMNTTDNSMDILNKLPRFLSKAAIRFIRWLDRHGWCPDFLIGDDPNYSSVFLSNLGSIRLTQRLPPPHQLGHQLPLLHHRGEEVDPSLRPERPCGDAGDRGPGPHRGRAHRRRLLLLQEHPALQIPAGTSRAAGAAPEYGGRI